MSFKLLKGGMLVRNLALKTMPSKHLTSPALGSQLYLSNHILHFKTVTSLLPLPCQAIRLARQFASRLLRRDVTN